MITQITNDKDLRLDYEILRLYEKLNKKHPGQEPEIIRQIKVAIRKYRDRKADTEARVISQKNSDSMLMLVQLPEWVEDEEMAEEVFRAYYFMPVPNSQYDCTGKPFTGWHKVFKRRGRYMMYHNICFDV